MNFLAHFAGLHHRNRVKKCSSEGCNEAPSFVYIGSHGRDISLLEHLDWVLDEEDASKGAGNGYPVHEVNSLPQPKVSNEGRDHWVGPVEDCGLGKVNELDGEVVASDA